MVKTSEDLIFHGNRKKEESTTLSLATLGYIYKCSFCSHHTINCHSRSDVRQTYKRLLHQVICVHLDLLEVLCAKCEDNQTSSS